MWRSATQGLDSVRVRVARLVAPVSLVSTLAVSVVHTLRQAFDILDVRDDDPRLHPGSGLDQDPERVDIAFAAVVAPRSFRCGYTRGQGCGWARRIFSILILRTLSRMCNS